MHDLSGQEGVSDPKEEGLLFFSCVHGVAVSITVEAVMVFSWVSSVT